MPQGTFPKAKLHGIPTGQKCHKLAQDCRLDRHCTPTWEIQEVPLKGSNHLPHGNVKAKAAVPAAQHSFQGTAAPFQSQFNLNHPSVSPPFFMQVRNCIQWWEKAKATKEVLHLLWEGVQLTHHINGNLSMQVCKRNLEETSLAMETIQEYLEVGAIKEICPSQAKHLIPLFVIKREKS